MSALETSIENLTVEHTALTQKLEQIDQQYRVERPTVVTQISQLARALSALTGKPMAGVSGSGGRKPMSEEGKAAIKAGLEKARAAKAAAAQGKPPVTLSMATVPSTAEPVTSAKKSSGSEKGTGRAS